jgi:N-glycosyltransferase
VRVLITVHPAVSHLRAVVPIALALRRGGHAVAVATCPPIHDEVRAYGLEPLPAGARWTDVEVAAIEAVLRRAAPDQPWRWAHLFLRELTDPARLAADVVALAPTWRPDVIVHDRSELGGPSAARQLGLPCVTVGTLAGAATLFGMSPPDTDLYASLLPEVYEPAEPGAGEVRRYRHEHPLLPHDRLPEWVADLPVDRPLVYLSLGTVFHQVPGRLEAMLAGLAGVECTVVAVAGDPGRLPPQPAHVRLAASLPQPLMLECCDLFVTHGGTNSVREALALGVPMVIAPIVSDQPYNARRCQALGVARSLPQDEVAPSELAAACREVLGDPAYRERARDLQGEFLALPPLDRLVRDIEVLRGG